jgi:Cu(I)/Ag(I) efflux system membrane fusion protein
MRLTPTRAVLLTLLVLALGWGLGHRAAAPSPAPAGTGEQEAAAEPTTWTCSMHPSVKLPAPGQCPICFMDLIPLVEDPSAGAHPTRVRLSAGAAALAAIRTAEVARLDVAHERSLAGKVALDETRVATISTWVPGRLERLYVDFTGVRVRPGDHLVELYSPQLYAAQQELKQARAAAARMTGGSLGRVSDATVAAARSKLRLLGLDEAQVAEIEASGELLERLTLHAPIGGVVIEKQAVEGRYVDTGTPIYTIADLSRVWVELEAYETDLAWLRYGQEVSFQVEAYPGEVFHGRIAFVDPLLDDATRTVRVRLNVANPEQKLKPEMFVRATVRAELGADGRVVDAELAGQWMCPMHPEEVADAPGTCGSCGMDLVPAAELGFRPRASAELPLVVPATAPLLTGRRAVVYVAAGTPEEPAFDGRVVTLGPRAGDWYVVLDGLEEGERVVVQGAFKLDSELQLQGRTSMMHPAEEEAAPEPADAVPAAFQEQLGTLLPHALAVQVALAADDLEAARGPAGALGEALGAVADAALLGEARSAWNGARAGIARGAEGVAMAADIEAARAAFQPLSDGLIAALTRFGYRGGPAELQRSHCPMAFDDQGAEWLQLPGTLANPYFGSAMLRCGTDEGRFTAER